MPLERERKFLEAYNIFLSPEDLRLWSHLEQAEWAISGVPRRGVAFVDPLEERFSDSDLTEYEVSMARDILKFLDESSPNPEDIKRDFDVLLELEGEIEGRIKSTARSIIGEPSLFDILKIVQISDYLAQRLERQKGWNKDVHEGNKERVVLAIWKTLRPVNRESTPNQRRLEQLAGAVELLGQKTEKIPKIETTLDILSDQLNQLSQAGEEMGGSIGKLQQGSDQLSKSLADLAKQIETKAGSTPSSTKIDYSVQREDKNILDYLRSSIVLLERPNVTFDQIGGQESAINVMKVLSAQLKRPEVFRKWGVKIPRGIMLYGPPGTGKTLLAKALAQELDTGFVLASPANLTSLWIGQAEKLIKGMFTVAREEATKYSNSCILFIDEVDAFARSRNHLQWAIDATLLSILLEEIDGFESHKENVIVIAATNQPKDVDMAFLSRMTSTIEMPLPDVEGIISIFKIHFSQAGKDAGRILTDKGVNFKSAASQLKGYSGRDISDFVRMILSGKAFSELNQGSNIPLVREADLLGLLPLFRKIKSPTNQ